MEHLIDKDTLVAEIEKRIKETESIQPKFDQFWAGQISAFKGALKILDTLEVIEPYEHLIQYPSREDGIKAHAEDYSWNIESELFQQLTPEQQKLWRKEIEQACISGGYCGLNLQKDRRYKENLEVKEVDLDFQRFAKEMDSIFALPSSETKNTEEEPLNWEYAIAKHFYSLGLAQKGE